MIDFEKLQVVEIHWGDACGSHQSWDHTEELDNAISKMITVGYLFKENDEAITIIQSFSKTEDRCDNWITIPQKMITEIYTLYP